MSPGGAKHVAALRFPRGDTREIDRGAARPGNARDDFLLVALQPAHAHPAIAGDRDAARPRWRCSPPLSVPVTTVPKPATEKTRSIGNRGNAAVQAARRARRARPPAVQKIGETLAGQGRHRDDRRVGQQRRGRDAFADFFAHEVEPIGVDGVDLGQDDDAAVDAEQIEDRQVLDRLRHGTLVGGDDEEGGVDAADTGEHVLDEPLVAGDVDDADSLAARQREPREPEVDRHGPRFFLGQAVGIDAGQRFDQGRFAVVDVARPCRSTNGRSALAIRRARLGRKQSAERTGLAGGASRRVIHVRHGG